MEMRPDADLFLCYIQTSPSVTVCVCVCAQECMIVCVSVCECACECDSARPVELGYDLSFQPSYSKNERNDREKGAWN